MSNYRTGDWVLIESATEALRIAELKGAEKAKKGEGVKYDAGKIDPTFVLEYFPRALLAISAVAEYGTRKYTRNGWRTVDNAIPRYAAALSRHQLAQYIEGPYDNGDSGLAHLAQQAWNTLALLEKALELGAVEIRRGNDLEDGKPVLGTARKIA